MQLRSQIRVIQIKYLYKSLKVLSSFHTVFARLHNFAVDEILKVNPHWITDTSRVFHEARLFGKIKIILII